MATASATVTATDPIGAATASATVTAAAVGTATASATVTAKAAGQTLYMRSGATLIPARLGIRTGTTVTYLSPALS